MTEHPPELVQHIANYGYTTQGAKTILDAAKGDPNLAHLLAKLGTYWDAPASAVADIAQALSNWPDTYAEGITR